MFKYVIKIVVCEICFKSVYLASISDTIIRLPKLEFSTFIISSLVGFDFHVKFMRMLFQKKNYKQVSYYTHHMQNLQNAFEWTLA